MTVQHRPLPDCSQLVTIDQIRELYYLQFGRDLPYTTVYSKARKGYLPAFSFAKRVVFHRLDVPAILNVLSLTRERRPNETVTSEA